MSDVQQPDRPLGRRIKLWDLPTRLFHWSLVLSVTVAVATGLTGGNWMVWHGRAGIAIVGLLAFRLVWGVVGGQHARFANFVPTPRKLITYLRGTWSGLGHNPLGALSVLALLLLLALQAGTGLFSNDEIAFTGPLFPRVDEEFSLWLTARHQQLSNILFAWIGLHLLAIAYHSVLKRDNLVKPMLSGYKSVDQALGNASSRVKPQGSLKAFLLASSVALAATFAASGEWQPRAPSGASPDAGSAPAALAPGLQPAAAAASAVAPTW